MMPAIGGEVGMATALLNVRLCQKLLFGKMIVEGHSAGRNFWCNLISASPGWQRF